MLRHEELALVTSAGNNRVTFEFVRDCRIDDELVALVRGIEIGSRSIIGRFRRGATFDMPIEYFPWVELPAEVRFSLRSINADFARGFVVKTYDDSIALVGPGELEVERVRLSSGYLRGTVINRSNGLVQPQLYARVNSRIPRAVHLEHPRLRDQGGAECQFAVQLHAADVLESGCTIEIYSAASGAPLHRVSYTRDLAWNGSPVLSSLEQKVKQLEQTMGFQIHGLKTESRDRISLLEERIDTFIEYMSSLVFDKLAVERTEIPFDDAPDNKLVAPRVEGLRRAITQVSLQPTSNIQDSTREREVRLQLSASAFSYGWYNVENDGIADFRWMGSSGIVFNPEPDRLVSGVHVVVHSVYGADRPSIRAFLDHLPGHIEDQSQADHPPFRVSISWTDGDGARPLQAVRLESEFSASPAATENSDDARVLSISISEVTFIYAH